VSRHRQSEGTEAHYRDAVYYEQAYRRRRHDVRFYADLAEELGGPVLELGVGTGRVAREIARRGIDVVGVDLMREMLEHAEARLAREPRAVRDRVELRRGDLRDVRLGGRFPLVISPFNVFMHLYELRDVERALATVRAHLRPRGHFAMDVLMPDAASLARDPDRIYRCGTIRHTGDGRRYLYRERFRYDPVTQVQTIDLIFQDAEDLGKLKVTPLAHRQFFPAELRALLHYNGLLCEAVWGDFDRGALEDDSESQVVLARLAPHSRKRTSQ